MSRISKLLFISFAAVLTIGLIGADFDVFAKNKKKVEKKDDKKDPKKEEKKEEKKPEFKPDAAQQEFKPGEKEKSSWVYSVAFAADGKTVAATYRNHAVKIHDLAAKSSQALKSPEMRGLGDYKALLYVDGKILVGSSKLTKVVKEKEKEKPKEKAKEEELTANEFLVKAKAKEKNRDKDKPKDKVVPDVPIRQGEIKVWDAKTGSAGESLFGHTDNIEALAISKDGKFIASASKDTTVIIWDLSSRKPTQTIKGHTDDVIAVAFSPDGKRVVTGSRDRTLRVWEIADAKEVANFKVEREVEVKDPKGKVSKVKETGREFTCAVFSKDGKNVIAGNLDGAIKIYDIDGKKEVKELKAHEGVWALALSPDGSKFATGGWDGTIKIWASDGKELKTIKAHLNPSRPGEGGTVNSVSFSPEGQWLASGSIDGTVKIWSVK